jgi:hypothetical protein
VLRKHGAAPPLCSAFEELRDVGVFERGLGTETRRCTERGLE